MITAFTARYALPITSGPIEDGVVLVEDGRVVQVGRQAPAGAKRVDLNALNTITSGGVAILPGLVNVHTHLEFSNLTQPLGESGMPLPDWIRAVIAHRRQSDSSQPSPDKSDAIGRGCAENVSAGTTVIGDIAQGDWQMEPTVKNQPGLHGNGADVTLFREWLGLSDDDIEMKIDGLKEFEHGACSRSSYRHLGVSPHAPYSTHWKIIEEAANVSRQKSAPLAMHLAESLEELELLQTHGGPFRKLLNDLGVWNADAIPLGGQPMDYLKRISKAHRSLVIHGNFLAKDEIEFVAQHSESMSLVYCPRTHAYFQHPAYPLEEMLNAGAKVALGTDSRASSPDLNLLSELRQVSTTHPGVPPETVLRMGTINGARALGREKVLGSLEPGKQADMAVVALPDGSRGNVYEMLLNSSLPNVATFIGGLQV